MSHRPNAFSVCSSCSCDPGFSLRSNPGLELANAFAVFQTEPAYRAMLSFKVAAKTSCSSRILQSVIRTGRRHKCIRFRIWRSVLWLVFRCGLDLCCHTSADRWCDGVGLHSLCHLVYAFLILIHEDKEESIAVYYLGKISLHHTHAIAFDHVLVTEKLRPAEVAFHRFLQQGFSPGPRH